MVASSDSFLKQSSSTANSYAATKTSPNSSTSAMLISLPESRMHSPKLRRAAVTPPSVTPPSVSTDISSLEQLGRDRCKSPSQRAHALLAKVAVLPYLSGGTSPMPTCSGMTSPGLSSSNNSSPASSPPGEGQQFCFGTFPKQLPASPDGGYISFPDFDQFSSYNSEDEDSQSSKR